MKNLFYLLALAPTLLSAETFTIDTKVSEVTVYPQGVEVLRTGTYSIPAGTHRLVLLGVPASDPDTQLATMQVQADGLSRSALIVRGDDVPWHDYVSDEVKQAEDRVTDIESQITAVEDRAETARLRAEAARHKIAFLSNLGRNEGLAGSDAENLRGIAQMVGEESLNAENTAQTAEIEARKIEENLIELETQLDAARIDLAALLPETDERLFIAVDVIAEAASEGAISLSYIDFYSAEWQPGYDFNLITGDAPEIRIDRSVLVSQETGENWQDVRLSVSTLQPTGQNSASHIFPQRRSISEYVANLEEPVFEAPVVVEEVARFAPDPASVQGTGITYTLPEPISITSGPAIAEFALDDMAQSVELFALANPLHDETAYRTARFTNPYDQMLLSANFARWRVDGVLVATDSTASIGPKAEVEMGFGPLYALTVTRNILGRSRGDVGLISRSNQSQERAQIKIENLTGETWPLRILDRVPFSEQDDLEITWTAQPKPSEENVDNRRGILAWELELAPGQSETIQLDTKLSWPEGMELH
ncbi:DUF4139 domain-containing protein [Ruegeria arenilitoris]|uniref:DUF4139 domain-containing protein n=1 Tax=Ruegeria arenilitoris TaxID=1173585 RepID=UPI00148111B8|nr:DUF4139 domain-containing protein [Ruegeria arenilitoris]